MSKKCPMCGRGIGVYQDYVGGTSFFRCDICGHTGCDFEDMTIFDQIIQSPETLAVELVTLDCDGWWAYDGIGKRRTYLTREEAITATVAKLKSTESR